jgi:hypothetical protein
MQRVIFFSCIFFSCICAILTSVASAESPQDIAGIEFFEKNVRPLLAQHCYECHSAKSEDEPGGGLLLDSSAGWIQGGESGPALVSKDVSKSLILQAVRYESLEMPPAGRLPGKSVKILEEWVRRGAPAPLAQTTGSEHQPRQIDWDKAKLFWAFQPPQRIAPETQQSANNKSANNWSRQPLDRYIAVSRSRKGLEPAKESERRVWLRRVTYDLIGLPPTAEEWRQFEQDRHPLAYERVVDRLLASPQFGELWGRHWLDVARYADSNGSDFNATFYNAWRYRNYVISSFNSDRPFDQFVREQIAGDLLSAETDDDRYDQLVATTFLLVGPKMLSERDKPRLMLDVADEQIDTVGRVFQGLTLGCARCHDHKFDPIGTDDYYAMLGIMHSTESLFGESQQYVSTWRGTELPTSAEHREQAVIHQKLVKSIEKQLAQTKAQLKDLPNSSLKSAEIARGILVDESDAELTGNWKTSSSVKDFVGSGYIHDDNKEKGAKSARFRARLPADGDYEVRLSYCGGPSRADKAPVTIAHADGEFHWEWDQRKTPDVAGLFTSVGKFKFSANDDAVVTIETRGSKGFVIVDSVQFVPVATADGTPPDDSATPPKEAELEELRRNAFKEKLTLEQKRLDAELKSLKANAPPPLPKAMAVREAELIDDQAVRIRGVADRHGRIVPRGYLRILGGDERPVVTNRSASGRRELAEWIADRNNPLTARVFVNRVWSKLIGKGIVRSVDNFGRLGERPTHPELLDALAIDFMDQQWRIKPLVRRIVLSATYRQSTSYSERGVELDPDNRYLWRQNRKPLTAEQFRDSLLSVANRLNSTPGESPVAGLGKLAIDNSSQGESGTDTSGALRSLYLPVVRNDLSPFMVTFDFADPDMVVGKRPATNVPAQALMLLNDSMVREMAERLAELTWVDSLDRSTEKLFQSTFGRQPTNEEIERIRQFVGNDDDLSSIQSAWVDVTHSLLASTEYRWLD